MSARPFRAASALLAAALLGACTVGPDYVTPVADVPETFDDRPEPAIEERLELPELEWWAELGDPRLSGLIERAMQTNLDLQIAATRIAEARAFRRAQGGRLLPVIDGSTSGGRSKASARGPGPLAGLAEAGLAELENDLYTVGFDASWELDLWGRVRRAREASQARLEGSEELRRALLLTVAAEVAATYVDWAGATERLALAERNLDLQQSTLDAIEGKVDAGLAPPLDLQRAKAQVETTRGTLSPLRTAREAAKHRLAVLLGESPNALDAELAGAAPVPEPPAAVATGLPADLVWRRPDLRAAERERHAANADLGVAIADRFPRISVGGRRGFEAGSLGDLISSASRVWSYGPRIDLPIFRGGQLAAATEAARARLEAAELNWQRAVLGALEEVESTLVALGEARLQVTALAEAARAGREATELAQVLFDEGLSDYLNLLDAQRSQTQIDDGLALARIARTQRAIALYKALGGGWVQLQQFAEDGSAPPRDETQLAPARTDAPSAQALDRLLAQWEAGRDPTLRVGAARGSATSGSP